MPVLHVGLPGATLLHAAACTGSVLPAGAPSFAVKFVLPSPEPCLPGLLPAFLAGPEELASATLIKGMPGHHHISIALSYG